MTEKTIKIKGDKPIFGKVRLSGDTEYAIATIVYLYSVGKYCKIKNVPRSEKLLEFYQQALRIGMGIKWLSEDEIQLFESELNSDCSNITEIERFNEVQVLAPLLIKKTGGCVIDPIHRSEAKYYRNLGFNITAIGEKLNISRPFDTLPTEPLDVSKVDIYSYVSKIMTEDYEYSNLHLVNKELNLYHKYFENIKRAEKITRIILPFNSREFNLFCAIGLFSSAEITFENYNLSQFLNILLLFERFGLEYEIIDDKLKVWKKQKKLESYYDLTSFSIDVVGYSAINLISHGKKTTRLLVDDRDDLKNFVTDLNMMGAKIVFSDKESNPDYAILEMPHSTYSPLKNIYLKTEWGGNLILLAAISPGTSTISNFNEYAKHYSNLIDNLKNLNINIS